jgi:hypothetical protein
MMLDAERLPAWVTWQRRSADRAPPPGQPRGVSPDQAAHATRLAAEILTERLPPRRLRAFPRAVQRKMSNLKLKRPAHRSWPQPTRPDTHAIVLLPRPGYEIPQIGARR